MLFMKIPTSVPSSFISASELSISQGARAAYMPWPLGVTRVVVSGMGVLV